MNRKHNNSDITAEVEILCAQFQHIEKKEQQRDQIENVRGGLKQLITDISAIDKKIAPEEWNEKKAIFFKNLAILIEQKAFHKEALALIVPLLPQKEAEELLVAVNLPEKLRFNLIDRIADDHKQTLLPAEPSEEAIGLLNRHTNFVLSKLNRMKKGSNHQNQAEGMKYVEYTAGERKLVTEAKLLMQEEHFEKALEIFLSMYDANRKFHNDPSMIGKIIMCYKGLKQWQDCLYFCDIYLNIGETAIVLITAACAAKEANDWEKCLDYCERGLTITPNNLALLGMAGMATKKLNKVKDSLKYDEKMLSLGEDTLLLKHAIFIAYLSGELKKCLHYGKRLIALQQSFTDDFDRKVLCTLFKAALTLNQHEDSFSIAQILLSGNFDLNLLPDYLINFAQEHKMMPSISTSSQSNRVTSSDDSLFALRPCG